MSVPLQARLATNWTSAAGALEGVLQFLGVPLPRHAVMGLSGHAWHFCLGSKEDVVALPSGPANVDWEAAATRYARTGVRFERFGGECPPGPARDAMRKAAIEWGIRKLDEGRPLIGWDFHLHEFAVVYGYDREREGFLVDDVLSEEVGPIALWKDWPSEATNRIELFAHTAIFEPEPYETVVAALETALECLAGTDGPDDGQPRGIAGIEAWAEALDGDTEVDRAGNAYTLAVLQAARVDGAAFLEDLANLIPEAAQALQEAERAFKDEAQALSPLITLFPFPTGGHGNVQSPGLRQAAATALRKAAGCERRAEEAIASALEVIRG